MEFYKENLSNGKELIQNINDIEIAIHEYLDLRFEEEENLFFNKTGIKKVSRHILRAGKSAVYAASRLSVYYSNSIVPGGFPSDHTLRDSHDLLH